MNGDNDDPWNVFAGKMIRECLRLSPTKDINDAIEREMKLKRNRNDRGSTKGRGDS